MASLSSVFLCHVRTRSSYGKCIGTALCVCVCVWGVGSSSLGATSHWFRFASIIRPRNAIVSTRRSNATQKRIWDYNFESQPSTRIHTHTLTSSPERKEMKWRKSKMNKVWIRNMMAGEINKTYTFRYVSHFRICCVIYLFPNVSALTMGNFDHVNYKWRHAETSEIWHTKRQVWWIRLNLNAPNAAPTHAHTHTRIHSCRQRRKTKTQGFTMATRVPRRILCSNSSKFLLRVRNECLAKIEMAEIHNGFQKPSLLCRPFSHFRSRYFSCW